MLTTTRRLSPLTRVCENESVAPAPVPLVSTPAFEMTEGVALISAKDSETKKFDSAPVNAELNNNKQSDIEIIFLVFERIFFLEMISNHL